MQTARASLEESLQKYPNILIAGSLFVVAVYCILYAWMWSRLLPGSEISVNQTFAATSWRPLLLIAAVVTLMMVILQKILPVRKSQMRQPPVLADGLLVLLPLTPIFQYVVTNQEVLTFSGSALLVGVFGFVALGLTLAVPRILSFLGLGPAFMVAGLAFCYTIFNMASLTHAQNWFERGELRLQISLMLAVWAMLWVVYEFMGRKFARVIVILFFVANSAFSAMQSRPEEAEGLTFDSNHPLVALVGARQPKVTPNVYILVYDAYVANETMLSYGIDNSVQEDFLSASGFKLYPHNYSVSA